MDVELDKVQCEIDDFEWDKSHGYYINSNHLFVLREQSQLINERISEIYSKKFKEGMEKLQTYIDQLDKQERSKRVDNSNIVVHEHDL